MRTRLHLLATMFALVFVTSCVAGGISEEEANATAAAAVAEALAAIPSTDTPHPTGTPVIITVIHTAMATQIVQVPVTREVQVTTIVEKPVMVTAASTPLSSPTPFSTAQPQESPTVSATQTPPTPVPTQPPPAPVSVAITTIFFDGVEGQKEPDEYVEIRNTGERPVQLGGWRLYDEGSRHSFTFPAFELQPGQSCRIYTNQEHPDWCSFDFQQVESAIWNNGGDCAYLYSAQGDLVARQCY